MFSYFPGQKIISFKSSDFILNSDSKINIKEKVLTFILFIDESKTSQKLEDIWIDLSKTIAGANFGICNLLKENDIADTFSKLANDFNSDYMKFATDTPPFILCYRGGYPKEKYNDVTTEYDIHHWCLQHVTGRNKNINGDNNSIVITNNIDIDRNDKDLLIDA